MSKAVLITDMPVNCVSCHLYKYQSCVVMRYHVIENALGRPNWCPLRPLPSAKKERAGDSILIMGHKRGFNDCLEAIGGWQNE